MAATVPAALLSRALDELGRLHGLISDFVQAHRYTAGQWRSHPAIKPLFDYIDEEQNALRAIEAALGTVEEEEAEGDKVIA